MQLLTLTVGLGLLSVVQAMMPPLSPASSEQVMALGREGGLRIGTGFQGQTLDWVCLRLVDGSHR